MIYINKKSEPHSLTEHRLKKHAHYGNLFEREKDDIRQGLLREQGWLCAYCMRRIDETTIRIEHFVAQSVDPSLALEYKNMLGVCPGNEGQPFQNQTCDRHRKNTALTVSPLQSALVAQITYTSDGLIQSKDANIHYDVTQTLNLNTGLLARNRKSALDALKRSLYRQKMSGDWKRPAQRYIHKLLSDDVKMPYCGIMLWYLDKKTR